LDRVEEIWDPLRKPFATPGVPSRLRACFALMGLAFIYLALPACLVVYVPQADLHLISVFCEVIVAKKCTMSSPGGLLLFGRPTA